MRKLTDFFTVKELAKTLGMSRQAVDKRIRSRGVDFETRGRTRLIHKEEAQKVLR